MLMVRFGKNIFQQMFSAPSVSSLSPLFFIFLLLLFVVCCLLLFFFFFFFIGQMAKLPSLIDGCFGIYCINSYLYFGCGMECLLLPCFSILLALCSCQTYFHFYFHFIFSYDNFIFLFTLFHCNFSSYLFIYSIV